MSKKGHYPGGHIVVHGSSDWFAGKKKLSRREREERQQLSSLREQNVRRNIAPNIYKSLRAGKPMSLPLSIKKEIEAVGGKREWLNKYFYGEFFHPDEEL